MTAIKKYSELIRIPDFKGRFEYLKLSGTVGESTFGFDRYLNQALYRSREWKQIRNEIIVRDNGFDMGLADYPADKIIVHHMNPINENDIWERDLKIFDPEFLICVSHNTHNAIHFGSFELLPKPITERRPGDTCPWK